MQIVIIGSGNTATVLGKKFVASGHRVVQIAGRNRTAAKTLARELNAEAIFNMNRLNDDADVYLIAVSDDAVSVIASHLMLPGKVVAHTAASVSKDVLKKVTNHYAVFYPLQSLRKEIKTLPVVPVFIEAATAEANAVLTKLGESISPGKVLPITAPERMKLHLAAVIVNNFTNHLYQLAEAYCNKEHIAFKNLQPLIEETALRLNFISPSDAQTGPAFRNDADTIRKHIALLKSHPELRRVYSFLSESIRKQCLNT